MRRFFQRLLLPVAVIVVTQISFVSAESIRLVGPDGQVQPTPQYSDNIVRNQVSDEPGTFFGPTTSSQTLWSIASQLRPSPRVTVQQTLLAIYQLNPQAFENQNIHTLIPGSTLRIPSLAQISRNSNQEAVNIMAAHQAKLNQTPVVTTPVPARPTQVAKTEVAPPANAEESLPPKVEPKATPEVVNTIKPSPSTDKEVMALEEKNHTLRVMLSQVQSEVSTLKQELGDENRIRSEVEKLLEEERRKAEEAQRLAPSAMDNLLSNGWLVALLALIPGLLIAIVLLLLLNRRSATQQQDMNQSNVVSDQAASAPMAFGPDQTDDIGDDLLLDDDLFSTTDEKEEAEPEKAFSDDDVFADLNETDLDFNLDGQDSEDLFVGIDDDGDLDTEFDALGESSNGISVNSEDKALGLEEMERALNDVTEQVESDDLASFDLADEDQMSEDDIEALLAGEENNELLDDGKVDQSLLDDLLASELDALDEDPTLQDTETLDTLLNDELDLLNEGSADEFDLSGAGVADGQELDNLFASIEEQADLEHLEATAVDETALLDEMIDDVDNLVAEDSTELLEELLDDIETPDIDELGLGSTLTQLEDTPIELELDSTQLLDEVLGEPELIEESVEQNITEESTELLDELLDDFDLDDDSIKATEFAVSPEKLSVEDGTELFDELLEIEQQAEQEQQELAAEDEFNSDTFIDDLLNSAPAKDPLLEPQLDENESFTQSDDFDFNPEIEGGIEEEIPLKQTLPANEFGIPQDDDWVFEEEGTQEADVAKNLADNELELDEVQSEDDEATLATLEQPSAKEPLIDSQIESESEPLAAKVAMREESVDPATLVDDDLFDESATEMSVEAPEPELATNLEQDNEESFTALDELDLPEYTEEDALADAIQEPVAEPELATNLEQDNEESFTALDELDLPEYTEEDALADAIQEPVAEPELATNLEQDNEESFTALDELDLPEYTEEDALADAIQEPVAEPELATNLEQDNEESFTALDELDLPEYTEEDALADAIQEPVAEPELATNLEQDNEESFTALDELDLPEYTEEDALADAIQEPVAEPELATNLEQDNEESFTALDELDLPEYTEADALADAIQEPVAEPELATNLEQDNEESFTALDELDLPEYTEEDALADAIQEPVAEPELATNLEQDNEESFTALDELDLPEYTEEDALADAIQEPVAAADHESDLAAEAEQDFTALNESANADESEDAQIVTTPQPTETAQVTQKQGYDEEALHDWLSENPDGEKPFSFDRPLDAKTIDSAGMDIDAMLQMGGEDWNGFHLTPDQQAQLPDEVPEDEQAIWASETPEPEAKSENWGSQEDLLDFDPQRDGYMTIDELMAQVESEEQSLNPDEEELKLDVGLDEFPDVIGDIRDIDVDSGAEAAGKLDLAKIYIEMNDEKGAIKLLEEAIVDGDDEIRQQAKRLIDVLNGRV
ncbi:AAA ATPase [Vibrio sp. RC586]|uniref:FimV/HubP family polar landmark protein n=1 Tax=Vibrio sp. RC586 TaxID=675815 RepID=UPI0001BB800F|nr:FimV/HubP family polar landmark protein [Vibrio sp. RC586]EEZ00576.1 AAA ATPase [Vibrio sp. RC586]